MIWLAVGIPVGIVLTHRSEKLARAHCTRSKASAS
jgi:hypothetical protein